MTSHHNTIPKRPAVRPKREKPVRGVQKKGYPYSTAALERNRHTVLRWLEAQEQTQTWLAAELGLTPSALNHYLFGRRRMPGAVATALEVLARTPIISWYPTFRRKQGVVQ